MAIQIPNAGTGNGATGDNEFVLWTKVINNFNDQTNAANKTIGTGVNQIPLPPQIIKAAHSNLVVPEYVQNAGFNCNTLGAGDVALVAGTGNLNAPPNVYGGSDQYIIYVIQEGRGRLLQIAYGYGTILGNIFMRNGSASGYSEWKAGTTQLKNYTTTTASAPNLAVSTTGEIQRSVSSEKYKNILGDLALTDESYQQALQVKPIIYRSLADADPDNHHYFSFSAEELGAYDPAFTFWQTHKVDEVTGEKVVLAEKEAEGINLNAITAMLHATNIKQGSLIKDLQEQIDALKPQMEV